MKKKNYSADQIQVLKASEHIRLRPGMYIGSQNFQGFTQLIKDCIKEAVMSYGFKSIKVNLSENGDSTIRLSEPGNQTIQSSWTKISNNWKGVGICWCVLASLSERMSITYRGSNMELTDEFHQGESDREIERLEIDDGEVEARFQLDKSIWGENFRYNYQYFSNCLREYAFLDSNISITLTYGFDGRDCLEHFHFDGGLRDLLELERLKYSSFNFFELDFDHDFGEFKFYASLSYRTYVFGDSHILSFANYEETIGHGVHLTGLLEGLSRGLKKYIKTEQLETEYKVTLKEVKKYLILGVHVTLDDPYYLGATKSKLGNKGMKKKISDFVEEQIYLTLSGNQELAKDLLTKFSVHTLC